MRCGGPGPLTFWSQQLSSGDGEPHGVLDPQTKHTAPPGMKPPRRPGSIHPAKMSPQIYPGPARPLCTVARQTGADLVCCRAGGRQESFFRTRRTLSRCSHLDVHTETDAGTTVFMETSAREGNGTPLQYSCLENPMDREAWWAAVHGVAKSWARLRDFTFTFHFHALEKEMGTHSSVLAWRIPGTGEPGGLPSMGSHRVRHD